jgi:hypothetical protein
MNQADETKKASIQEAVILSYQQRYFLPNNSIYKSVS